jgi:hypothetical protein
MWHSMQTEGTWYLSVSPGSEARLDRGDDIRETALSRRVQE